MPSTAENTNNPVTTNENKKSGSKGLMIAIIAILLVVIAPVLAFKAGLIRPPAWLLKNMPASMLTVVTPLAGEEAKLATMMQTGQSGVCTFTDKETGDQMIYYVKGEMFRMESTDTYDDETVTHFVMNDGEYQYMWTDQENEGTKVKMPTEEELKEMEEKYQDWADDLSGTWGDTERMEYLEDDGDENMDVKCDYKNVSNDLFQAPTNVNFMEFGEMFGWDNDSDFNDTDSLPSFEMPSQEDLEAYEELGEEMEDWAQRMQEQYETE